MSEDRDFIREIHGKQTQDMQEAIDKSWPVYRLMLFASAFVILSLAGAFLGGVKWMESTSKSSSFVGYSDSTWQVRDTLFVRYKGKVTGIDLTRLEEK